MAFRYQEIADRLRAFRLGSGMSAEEVARRVGISRTALYRFEKGELAKIETLEKLSELLGVSMPTLLGVGIEYMPSAVSYFERMRQFEETAEHIMVLSGPISFLLASDSFLEVLDKVLRESLPMDLPDKEKVLAQVDQIMAILAQRKETYRRRKPGILNLISARALHRFIQNGMVGNSRLPPEELKKRQLIARAEVEHFAKVIEDDAIGVQIGVVTESLPHTNFQIFRMADRKMLTISPFNLGEQPNIRLGVAMVTSAPEAIELHEKAVSEMWRGAIKGPAAAAHLRALLANPTTASYPPAIDLPVQSSTSAPCPDSAPFEAEVPVDIATRSAANRTGRATTKAVHMTKTAAIRRR
ncbi:helix-turn-helix domain-containing protein (plasmid) [Alicycliphilus denitrificans]|uniref:Helix-turn-helix domain-containing protein n=1 Tax=Alicycliphilus denitrificans TaxID=179636 RepID=A0A858ZMS3_9BURK|nr:helix-turn-helix domain-containing protein [Alicycliphilus denitrificans]QKD42118.1 helix-turn-helix domain-containing protein [Alicycliphilus denitrificans]